VKPVVPIPVLETERLQLRPFTLEDEAAVFALASNPEVARFVRFEAHRTPAETRAFLELVEQHCRRGDPFAWAIVRRGDDRPIGSCGFVSQCGERRSAEIGYWLGKPYWGKGYAVEAARALVHFGFEQMGLDRVEAKCFAENCAGQRVIEKLGMKFEGTDRSEMIKGDYPELRVYAIVRQDWRGYLDPNSTPRILADERGLK
jgi:ribosomal-protein-alanine N-acetyltransferase